MGVKDGFAGANSATKIAFFIVFLAVVVNWIAFCTTSWYVAPGGTGYQGLWRSCNGALTCGTMLDGSPNDEYDAIQAFAIFGFMGLNVGFLLIILYMFWGSCKGNGETGVASAIILFVSAGCWVISLAIFGSEYEDFPGRFGYSFALAACAGGLAVIGGIIMLIGGGGNSSVSSK